MPARHTLLIALLHQPELIVKLLAQVALHILCDTLYELICHLLIIGSNGFFDQLLE